MNILSQQIMSENEEGDEDQELLVKTKPKTKRPPLYKVLLINDDYTPMEFVVMILERFFGLTHAPSCRCHLPHVSCTLLRHPSSPCGTCLHAACGVWYAACSM